MFMNEKLSSRLEFPHSLNLAPYTREGLANQPLKTPSDYKLKGVVVHKGTA
jgi:ubiquitin carboxyl-terminal hydrolase 9/24